jgi:Cytochrome P460
MRSLAAAALIASLGLAVLFGCASQTKPINDGEAALPADYRTWPKYLTSVQRPDAKEVRDIYINSTGADSKAAQSFANGTVLVMENFAVQVDAAGNPVTGADGKLIRGNLVRVFVMAKGAGYGATVPRELKTGDWVYAAYDASGTKTADSLTACRSCHIPLAKTDFVFRVDEYYATRAKDGY